MNKLLISLLFLCFPALVLADGGSLSFAPPPGDYSVVFLGNIFGVVDGVLHGTGSQIMGALFGVFNAAVLAIGGIVIMYTLIVSTLNTAGEGEVLGSKWSSIWIPLRSALGLALLIPKASGYCVMQIIFMWIVIQGVGAADKVWNAALDYLNRGGVIVQVQQGSFQSMNGANNNVAIGAAYVLTSQVCMLGLQTALELARQGLLNQQNLGPNICTGPLEAFCNAPVPDFINSVNVVAVQQAQSSGGASPTSFQVSLPNFTAAPYSALNGICGTLTWNAVTYQGQSIQAYLATTSQGQALASTIGASGLATAEMSRAIALQQMYLDLSTIAQVIINNNPILNPPPPNNNGGNTSVPFSSVANQQFGVPYLASGTPCTSVNTNCVMWGSDTLPPGNSSAPLFSGVEFQGAIADYTGIMMPTLNLLNQMGNLTSENALRSFIQGAESNGWIMAGAYFYNLSQISNIAPNGASGALTDTDPGFPFDDPSFAIQTYVSNGQNGCSTATGAQGALCQWFQNKTGLMQGIVNMISGPSATSTPSLKFSTLVPTSMTVATHNATPPGSPLSATVFGFINNSLLVELPGQPGLTPPTFNLLINLSFTAGTVQLPSIDFGCGSVKPFFSICLGSILGDIFYNLIFRNVYNTFINALTSVINEVFMGIMVIPLEMIAGYFQDGIKSIESPTVNPIIALAQMGIQFINMANNLWIQTTIMEILTSLSIIGFLMLMPLMIMAMPLLTAWISTMVSIGFVTAYYIPFLPYMIFTFGGIAWLMAVIEAMVAAPIVALGITHPEGHDAFGKADAAVMIIMNIFLRPAMMIIGYIAAISLSYVSVWVVNAGFTQAVSFIGVGSGVNALNYTNWAGLYAMFFSVLMYVSIYTAVVTKAFTLITYLPDKVLRWIGGAPESLGGESTQWAEESKGKIEKAGGDTAKGMAGVQAGAREKLSDSSSSGEGSDIGAAG